jgi:myosin heavy subunit
MHPNGGLPLSSDDSNMSSENGDYKRTKSDFEALNDSALEFDISRTFVAALGSSSIDEDARKQQEEEQSSHRLSVPARAALSSSGEYCDHGPSPCDLIELSDFSPQSMLNHLKLRFRTPAIYTRVGDILISINPYEEIAGVYGDEAFRSFRMDDENKYVSGTSFAPHIFAIAREAYRQALGYSSLNVPKSQSILISGESGAG